MTLVERERQRGTRSVRPRRRSGAPSPRRWSSSPR